MFNVNNKDTTAFTANSENVSHFDLWAGKCRQGYNLVRHILVQTFFEINPPTPPKNSIIEI